MDDYLHTDLQKFLKETEEMLELDFRKLPSFVFMKHLRKQIIDNANNKLSANKLADIVLPNIKLNFSALGFSCDKKLDDYLYELAGAYAKILWKLYASFGLEFGSDVFAKQMEGISLEFTNK